MRKYRRRAAIQATHAHPMVQWLFREMHRQRIDFLDLAERVGLGKHTIKDWARRRNPSLPGVEAALNALGYRLIIMKMEDDPPKEKVGSAGRVR